MTVSHLDDLRQALERKGWRVAAVLDGDGRRFSASWEIRRNAEALALDFLGLDDRGVRPLDQAYGVEVRGAAGKGLYFSRVGWKGSRRRERWVANLEEFLDCLEP